MARSRPSSRRAGCDLRDPLWSARVLLEAPELIRQVHADYFAAGADVAITASYQATFAGFARRGLDVQRGGRQLMRLAVRLAAEARDAFWADEANRAGRPRPPGGGLGSGCMAHFWPTVWSIPATTAASEDLELVAFHRPRIGRAGGRRRRPAGLRDHPRAWPRPARWRGCWPSSPASAPGSLSFSARDDAHTCHGEPIGECAAWLDGCEQVLAIGVNCTAPRHIAGLVRAIRVATRKPILVYPNSGEAYLAGENAWDGPSETDDLAAQAREWHAYGAQLIGGCCRTTPAQIGSLARWARSIVRSPT